jgi:hypothetical protein
MALGFACERLVEIDDLTCECDLPVDLDVVNNVLDGASDFLALLAGVQLGRCTAFYRPCRRVVRCFPANRCGCCGLTGIHLPGNEPTITGVAIDGATLPTTDYVVITTPQGFSVLERIDGEYKPLSWPTAQNILAPPTELNTFEITVESGLEIDMSMRLAAAEIACDVFAALAGAEHVLPQGTVSAIAYGLQVSFLRFGDPTDQATMTLAGLAWTQRFLASMPTSKDTQILAPEIDDGWDLYQR